MSPRDWLAQILAVERSGDLLTAYDLADQALLEHPGDAALQHRAVLLLARAGATAQAQQRLQALQVPEDAGEDLLTLGPRLAKDAALRLSEAERSALLQTAASGYEGVFRRTHGYYPAINAATLLLLSGDTERSRELAQAAIDAARSAPRNSAEASYYALATEAEALLLLGRESDANTRLAEAHAALPEDLSAHATTRRQLRLVCSKTGADEAVLAPLSPPTVLHFGSADADAGSSESATAVDQIAQRIETAKPRLAFGMLATPADVVCAEALLARGAELHVVLSGSRLASARR